MSEVNEIVLVQKYIYSVKVLMLVKYRCGNQICGTEELASIALQNIREVESEVNGNSLSIEVNKTTAQFIDKNRLGFVGLEIVENS